MGQLGHEFQLDVEILLLAPMYQVSGAQGGRRMRKE
jgi:hypothetical protein